MESLTITKARETLADLLNRVAYAKNRIRITKRGKQIAAVIPIEDLEMLERFENEGDLQEPKKDANASR